MSCLSALFGPKIEFLPPHPTYSFRRRNMTTALTSGENYVSPYDYSVTLADKEGGAPVWPPSSMYMSELVTSRSIRIPVFALAYPGAQITILLSHGGSSDAGSIRSFAVSLAYITRCNVVYYDYTGYGLSFGKKPTVSDIQADVTSAMVYALDAGQRGTFACSESSVVAYGIGDAGIIASTFIASQYRIGGLIVQDTEGAPTNRCMSCQARNLLVLHADSPVGINAARSFFSRFPSSLRSDFSWSPHFSSDTIASNDVLSHSPTGLVAIPLKSYAPCTPESPSQLFIAIRRFLIAVSTFDLNGSKLDIGHVTSYINDDATAFTHGPTVSDDISYNLSDAPAGPGCIEMCGGVSPKKSIRPGLGSSQIAAAISLEAEKRSSGRGARQRSVDSHVSSESRNSRTASDAISYSASRCKAPSEQKSMFGKMPPAEPAAIATINPYSIEERARSRSVAARR